MKLINFRLKLCLGTCIVLAYLLLAFVLFVTDTFGTQPVPIKSLKNEPQKLTKKTPRPLRKHIQRTVSVSKPHKLDTHERKVAQPERRPSYRYSHRRTGVKFVMGVPTAMRLEKNYLLDTLDELIRKMSIKQQGNSLIVIYVGEWEMQRIQYVVRQIKEKHIQHLKEGLIDIISPPLHYYPDIFKLNQTLKDKPNRVDWHSKQNLDYLYLMTYAQSRGSYYLQLADDILPNTGFLDYIDKFAALHRNFRLDHLRAPIVFSFSELGFIGKLFEMSELKDFTNYIQLFYKDQPIDWLLQSYVTLRSCRWDKTLPSHCTENYLKHMIQSTEPQFLHKGDDTQKWSDSIVEHQRMPHLKQAMNLIYDHKNVLMTEQLKQGETFIWGYMPQESSIMKYLRDLQFQRRQIRIKSAPESTAQFTDLTVNVLRGLPTLKGNSVETQNCGFLMSYTYDKNRNEEISNPNIIYYYMTENEQGTAWFRRFFWSGQRSNGEVNWKIEMSILFMLWSMAGGF